MTLVLLSFEKRHLSERVRCRVLLPGGWLMTRLSAWRPATNRISFFFLASSGSCICLLLVSSKAGQSWKSNSVPLLDSDGPIQFDRMLCYRHWREKGFGMRLSLDQAKWARGGSATPDAQIGLVSAVRWGSLLAGWLASAFSRRLLGQQGPDLAGMSFDGGQPSASWERCSYLQATPSGPSYWG